MFPVTDVTDVLLDFTMTRANQILTLARQKAVAVNIKTDTPPLLTSLSSATWSPLLYLPGEYSGHRASRESWSMVCVMFVVPPAWDSRTIDFNLIC